MFGLRAGMVNLITNGLRLGARKTIGKITQPINAYSRFPEYYWFEAAVREHFLTVPADLQPKVLDVGSPKMLGLYLGVNTRAELTLTDISDLNVDEYRLMWRGLEGKAKGKVMFSLADARSLEFGDAEFDVVYSMSVIEHIEGEEGDSRAIRELLRVLKPGGLLVLSVPFGNKYVEQKRIGFSGAARKTGDREAYFFQRIYGEAAFQKRILEHAVELEHVNLITVSRQSRWMSRAFGLLGENVRGALGFMNPLLSLAINRSRQGMNSGLAGDYGEFHTARDVYGDLIMTGRKK
jgi:SAM-dependent methyltransferase